MRTDEEFFPAAENEKHFARLVVVVYASSRWYRSAADRKYHLHFSDEFAFYASFFSVRIDTIIIRVSLILTFRGHI